MEVIIELRSVNHSNISGVDNLLKFDLHVDHIKDKIQKRVGAMYRGGSLLPAKYRKMFANALMFPHFDCLDTIYIL